MRQIDPDSNEASFDLDMVVDKVPYSSRVTPFDFNGEKRFRVKVNNGEEHVFAWDAEMMSLKALDDSAATLPDDYVRELSDRLVRVIDQGR